MRKMVGASLVVLSLFLAVAGVARTKQYDVQLGQAVQADSMQLKPGTYQVEIDGNSLVFYQKRKEVAKVPVRTEELPKKNDSTSVTLGNGKLIAIQLSGTKTKLVVENP